jgi:hypothetical protein
MNLNDLSDNAKAHLKTWCREWTRWSLYGDEGEMTEDMQYATDVKYRKLTDEERANFEKMRNEIGQLELIKKIKTELFNKA